MDWYALETRADEKVAGDLTLASVVVYRAMSRIEFWDGRRSIVRVRHEPLLPGVLLVGSPSIPRGATREWHRYMQSAATRLPLRVHDADDFIMRCERGDFDVRHEDRHYKIGDTVLVTMLGVVGEVVSRPRGRRYEVEVASGRVTRRLTVGQGGLALA